MSKMQVRERAGVKFEEQENAQLKTLGHLRLRDEDTNEVILVPTPSNDPKDPLNWYFSPCPHILSDYSSSPRSNSWKLFSTGQNGSSYTQRWQCASP